METNFQQVRKTRYMNPYVAGVLLGLVVLAANFIAGRGVGASGAVKSTIVAAVETIAPQHAANATFYKDYGESHGGNPLNSWLVYQMLGVLVGAFLSGIIAHRMKWKVEHSPKITSKRRLIFALMGGILFGFGSQLGRGCTSGSALSGMAVLSLQGFISMAAIFGTAFTFAYFFRKNWI
ncbi:MAG TPA: YeeE/YedE thiosulfate transporter family protein [Bacteroidales bacterium]|nr:YeeE/YedE thiosulfate transporter family protein [Bacteroidales bacterium]HRZ20640.1 YeeE/YedE thiosulfate transporter family protein [Bacteroidales bacterium]